MLEKGNSFYLLAIYLIVKKYANMDEPLSIRHIKQHIQTIFQEDKLIDTRTVKVHLQRIRQLEGTDLVEELVELEDGASTSYYFIRSFDDTQIRLLADIIASSKYITLHESKELIKALYEMNGQDMPTFYHNSLKNKIIMTEPNPAVFYSVEQIALAIEQKKQVRCTYLAYNDQHELVPRARNAERVLNIHEIIWTSNYYYALCIFADTGKVYFLRIDKMKDVAIVDAPICELPVGFDINHYVSTQPHLFGGKVQSISFHIDKRMLDQVVDSFGKAAKLRDLGMCYKVELISSIEMMHVWLLQYSRFVTNIYPAPLKEKVLASLRQSIEQISQEHV